MFFKPKYKIVEVWRDCFGVMHQVQVLFFNLFYVSQGTYPDIKQAKRRVAKLMGHKICASCQTIMIKDEFGQFCPNEECNLVSVPWPGKGI